VWRGGLGEAYGTRNKRINEVGARVLVWLDRTDPRWLERLQVIRQDFGRLSGGIAFEISTTVYEL
jgi:hypothetical protein